MQTLFKTIHGSYLYGFNTADSDKDYYVVVASDNRRKKHYAKQEIVNGIDTTTVDFNTWLSYCDAGVPQALEAMFSTVPEVDLLYSFRQSYRVNTANAVNTYRRTIENFLNAGDFKRRRHALRLAFNLKALVQTGRFNPTVNSDVADSLSMIAENEESTRFAIEYLSIFDWGNDASTNTGNSG